jgi:hypothetical protein
MQVHRDALMIREVLQSMQSRDDLGWRAKYELKLGLEALVDLEKRLLPLVGKVTLDNRPLRCELGHPYHVVDLGLSCLHRSTEGSQKIMWPEEYEKEDGDE